MEEQFSVDNEKSKCNKKCSCKSGEEKPKKSCSGNCSCQSNNILERAPQKIADLLNIDLL